jgi:hypothetical protein
VNRFMQRTLRVVAPAFAASAILIAPSVSAQPGPPPPLPDNVQVVASGLVNPRGFTWGPDGALYVAEAGSPPPGYMPPAGPADPGTPPVINNDSRVVRVMPGAAKSVIVDNLPVFVGPLADTLGAASVAFIGNTLYVAIAAGPKHGHPEMAGGIYRVESGGALTQIVDMDAYNVANPPQQNNHDEFTDELSNSYDMISIGNRLYVTDGNKDLVQIVDPAAPAGSRVTRILDLSAPTHSVVTGIARGPDGNLYVNNLTSFPFPTAAARVWRMSPTGSGLTQVAAGISAGTGVAVAPDGSIYVSEIATTVGPPMFLAPPGRVVTASMDGVVPIASPLLFPTILRWGPDNALYGTVLSVAGDAGTGMIVRIETGSSEGPATTK